MNLSEYGFPQVPTVGFFIIFLWSIFWKGLALWRAAKQSQRNWFVALLVISSAGILDIIYLFFFANIKLTLRELKESVVKFNK